MGMLETVAILFFTEHEYRTGAAQEAVDALVDTEDLFLDRHGQKKYFQRVTGPDKMTGKRKIMVSKEVDA